MATEVYVASISNGCAIAAMDGNARAKEINAAAAAEGRLTSVDDLDRFMRERVHMDDILLYGLGVYSREVDILAPTVFENAVAAGRAGPNHSEAFNAGVMGCLQGRLDGVTPLNCPYNEGTKEYSDFHAGVAEGRELSPVFGAPFGMDEDEWNEE